MHSSKSYDSTQRVFLHPPEGLSAALSRLEGLLEGFGDSGSAVGCRDAVSRTHVWGLSSDECTGSVLRAMQGEGDGEIPYFGGENHDCARL